MTKRFLDWVVGHRWLVISLFCIITFLGLYSWRQLPIDAYPDIADVTVQVVTQVPGLAAEEIEQQITIPLERALNGTPNLSIMRSKNTFGLSIIILVFEDGTDDYWARQRVTERIAAVDLPYNAEPELNPLTSPTGEIYRYILVSEGNTDLRTLTDLNKWVIIPRLRQIQGVADVSNYGGITTQYQVELDPERMQRYGVSLTEIEEAIQANNSNAGGSMLDRGELSYVVRSVGLIHDLNEMRDIVVRTDNGHPIYLRDLGEVKYGNLERKGALGYDDDTIHQTDGVQGIVQMLRYQNPSAVLEQVHDAVDELNTQGALPHGVQIKPVMDRTHLVNTTLQTVSHTLLFGMLLVIAVLICFLGSPHAALLVAIAIPISLLVAFILMHFTDVPANLLSLGAIDFGILVDGSIVMMETIIRLREDRPTEMLKRETAVERMAAVAKPIFFATLIIIIAYMPLFAFQRIERKLFTPMAFTVGYALIGAMLTSLVLIPAIAYALYRKPRKIYHNKVLERLTAAYHRHTDWLLTHPRKLFAPIVAILLIVVGLGFGVGKDFLPELDEGGIWIQVQTPYGISLQRSQQFADTLRARLKQFDEVTYVMTQVGRDDEGAEAFTSSHIEVCVGLRPYNQWKWGRKKSDLVADMEAMIATMPGYQVGFSQPIIDMVMDQIAGSHSDLAVKIYGEDQDEARRIAEEVVERIKTIPGASDVVIDQEPPLPQLQIAIDRERVARYGLNVADVSQLIEVAIGGRAVSEVYVDGRTYDVTCRYRPEVRETPEQIGSLLLTSATGTQIPLSQVASVRTTLGASTLTREMNHRHLTVRINLRGRDLTSFLNEAKPIVSAIPMDHQKYSIRWDGQFENQRRAYTRLAVVIPFVLAIMFLLMFAVFGRFRQAGLLIGLLPLSLLGGLAALVIRGMSFNVSSAVGFIALFGLTIQNGVIMLSHINDLRKRGLTLSRAVRTGAADRLRPVLMTASVAIIGLFPASLATGIGSDVQRPLATVIVYGLLCSTIITLYVLPAFYYLIERHALIKNKHEYETINN